MMLDGNPFNGLVRTIDPNEKMTITKLLVFENKTPYNPVPIRSLSVNATHENLHSLNNLMSSAYDKDTKCEVNPLVLANKLPSLISVNHSPSGIADIPNGWGAERYRFVLEVNVKNKHSNLNYYVQGYSNYSDTSLTGLIDPNTWFLMNSITTVYRNYIVTTGSWDSRYGGTLSIIPDQTPTGITRDVTFSLVRPYDVLSRNKLEREYVHSDTVSFVGDLDKNIQTSNLEHISPIHHFSDTLNKVVTAMNNSKIADTPADILNTATKLAQPDMPLNNAFLSRLSNISGQMMPYYFTLIDLEKLGANVKDIITLVKQPVYDTLSANYINPTLNAIIATMISHTLPKILIDSMVTAVKFDANNSMGQNAVYIKDISSFILNDAVNIAVERLIGQIRDILLPQIAEGGMILYNMSVECSLTKDVVIDISTNGELAERYIMPLFANNTWCPIIADTDTKDMIINDFRTTIESTCI